MALTNVELLTVLGVLAILLGVIVANNVAAARATRRKARDGGAASWVGRHVQFAGDVVGEVVAEEGGRVVLRKGEETLVVPRSHVKPDRLDLRLASFDRDAALAEGAAWKGRGDQT